MSLKLIGCTVFCLINDWVAILTADGLVFYLQKGSIRKMFCGDLELGQVVWVYYDKESHQVKSMVEDADSAPPVIEIKRESNVRNLQPVARVAGSKRY